MFFFKKEIFVFVFTSLSNRTLALDLDLALLEPSPQATVSSARTVTSPSGQALVLLSTPTARLFPSLESPHRSVTAAEESEQLSPAASNLTETARAASVASLLVASTTATPTESASELRQAS